MDKVKLVPFFDILQDIVRLRHHYLVPSHVRDFQRLVRESKPGTISREQVQARRVALLGMRQDDLCSQANAQDGYLFPEGLDECYGDARMGGIPGTGANQYVMGIKVPNLIN